MDRAQELNSMILQDRAARGLVVIDDKDYDRRQFIGSSNVAAILGLEPVIGGDQYTAYDVYIAKTSDAPEEMDPDLKLFLERRKRWEPVVVRMLQEEFDAEIVSVNTRYRDPVIPYFAAEIDFEWVWKDGSGDVVSYTIENGEIKTVSPRAFSERFGWGEPGTGDVPIHYECQCTFGLGLTGRRRTMLAAMVGLDVMEFYPIMRDDETITKVRAKCVDFWEKYVLQRRAPEPQTISDINKMYANPKPGLKVNASSEVGSKALHLRGIAAQIDALQTQAEALEFDVKLAMKEAEELWVDGSKLYSWAAQNWSQLDQKGLKAADPKLHKKFMISGTRRVFKPLAGWKPQT
jgi:predicted phage-related endonuclease